MTQDIALTTAPVMTVIAGFEARMAAMKPSQYRCFGNDVRLCEHTTIIAEEASDRIKRILTLMAQIKAEGIRKAGEASAFVIRATANAAADGKTELSQKQADRIEQFKVDLRTNKRHLRLLDLILREELIAEYPTLDTNVGIFVNSDWKVGNVDHSLEGVLAFALERMIFGEGRERTPGSAFD
jgi:hypothetical protein